MKEIFVITEHRQGQIRDITFEMLTKGKQLAEKIQSELVAVLLGSEVEAHSKTLSQYATNVFSIKDQRLENFNSKTYQEVISGLIKEHKPQLTMIGHTSYGVDLAPSLATALNKPIATDCIDLDLEDGRLSVTRQMYGGKVNVKATVRESENYIVTIRQAAFAAENPAMNGNIIQKPSPLTQDVTEKRFIEYILPPPGGVDITAADVLLGVGRGVKDQANMPIVEDLAKTLGGVLACSRPIVDKGWLPSDRQVGTSGKTVKPKLYLALGISGAFQHVIGMKNSDLIIAVNKDANAPIFNFSDYGVVEDLFKIAPSLKSVILELKGQKT